MINLGNSTRKITKRLLVKAARPKKINSFNYFESKYTNFIKFRKFLIFAIKSLDKKLTATGNTFAHSLIV